MMHDSMAHEADTLECPVNLLVIDDNLKNVTNVLRMNRSPVRARPSAAAGRPVWNGPSRISPT